MTRVRCHASSFASSSPCLLCVASASLEENHGTADRLGGVEPQPRTLTRGLGNGHEQRPAQRLTAQGGVMQRRGGPFV
jgi:hypothetical protein